MQFFHTFFETEIEFFEFVSFFLSHRERIFGICEKNSQDYQLNRFHVIDFRLFARARGNLFVSKHCEPCRSAIR